MVSTVDDAPPQCAARLEAYKDQMTVLAPDILFEMVLDASAVTHAAAGDDQCTGTDTIDGHRLGGRLAQVQIGQHEWIAMMLIEFSGFHIIEIGMLLVDLGRFDGQRAV